MLVIVDPHEPGANQRTPFQVERSDGFLVRQLPQMRRTILRAKRRNVVVRQLNALVRLHELLGFASHGVKDRAQHVVPLDNRRQHRGQSVGIQIARDPRRHRDVIKRIAGLELIKEPQAALAKGKRCRTLLAASRNRPRLLRRS